MNSDKIKQGPGGAPVRSLFYGMGYVKEEIDRPLIGVVNAQNELIPGHMLLDRVAQAVKRGILLAGGTPLEFPAIGICDGSTRDIALLSRVNKPVCFLVEHLEQNPDGSITPILSRRQAQLLCRQELLSTLRPGDIIPARVTHLEPFGCFVDIGCGIPSLIPIDCISVSRIAHPGDRFRPGQDIRAIVTGIEENFRILLSHKELLGTWEENAACFSSGETVSGIVRSVEPYGIFVELAPNLTGLAEFKAGVRPGQHASVYIKSLIPDKMKIKLILIDSFDAVCRPDPPHYFVESGHLDCWVYSPASAKKQIQTVFSSEPA